MTIKQNGGIFGRNPTFNEVDATDITTESLSLLKNNPFVRLDDSDTDNNGEFRLDNTSVRIEADKDNAVAGSKIKFKIDNSEIGFFDENGHLDIDGNLVVASGQGIDFSATSGTGTSELFDDYEEGTWTPTLLGSTSGSASITTISVAKYVKIGRSVTVFSQLGGIRLDTDNISGNVLIGGLPFTSSTVSSVANFTYANILTADETTNTISGYVQSSQILLRKGSSLTAITDSDLDSASNGTFMVSATYQV